MLSTADVEALRSVEALGYRIAFFLLGDERLAAEATVEALLRLGGNDAFFAAGEAERREAMKREVQRASLEKRRAGRSEAPRP